MAREEEKGNAEGDSFGAAYSLTGEAKLQGVCDFIDTLMESECKFLVFAHHKVVMDGLEKFVLSKKVKYIRIDGSVANEKRHERVHLFQHSDDVRVAILSITACS